MYDTVVDKVAGAILPRYQIDWNSVPDHWTTDCSSYQAPLNIGLESRDRPFSISTTQAITEDESTRNFVAELVDEEAFEEALPAKESESILHELVR